MAAPQEAALQQISEIDSLAQTAAPDLEANTTTSAVIATSTVTAAVADTGAATSPVAAPQEAALQQISEIYSPARTAALELPKSVLDGPAQKKRSHTRAFGIAEVQAAARPSHNALRDSNYRSDMLHELRDRLQRGAGEVLDHGSVTNRTVYNLLDKSCQPSLDEAAGPVDAYFVSGAEAIALMEMGSPAVPVVTQHQQAFRWDDGGRPIEELFWRMEDLDRSVSVQVPSRCCGRSRSRAGP